MKQSGGKRKRLATARIADLLGKDLMEKLSEIHSWSFRPVYLSGGTVRDLLLGREPVDIDLTVPNYARKWAADLGRLTGGTYVPLGKEEDAARVVWQGRDIDFSSFREGAETISRELAKRDITINSMAVELDALLRPGKRSVPAELEVIDPVGGGDDLEKGIVRVTSSSAFRSDPLRLLRVFRFAAILDFNVDRITFEQVVGQHEMIRRPAAERVTSELDLIMQTDRAHEVMFALAESGLLFAILPELEAGVGMAQPASHHLDVFDHCLATLHSMIAVQRDVSAFFSGFPEVLEEYIASGRHSLQLRWAALLHDLGKPETMAVNENRGGRITFYNHDRAGAEQVAMIGRRMKWSTNDTRKVSSLVKWHMRPFHLANVQRREELSLRACLRLVRLAGEDLPGLLLLGMADALAGKGEERPEAVEREIAALFVRLEEVRREYVEPVRTGTPLLTGRDLIEELHLPPGPVFRKILDRVEEAHMEQEVQTREEALELARRMLSV